MRERYDEAPRGDGYFHVGNPQLDPERSTSFELGLKGNDGDFTYQRAAFHTRIDEYVADRVTGTNAPTGLPITRTETLDTVLLYGLQARPSTVVRALVFDVGFTGLLGANTSGPNPHRR